MDLAHPRCAARPSPDPLLRRILAPGDREWLEDGGPPEQHALRLWALWAAKEAAYKVHTQADLEAGRIFRPSLLACDLEIAGGGAAAAGPALPLRGRVRLEGSTGGEVEVEGTTDGECVHIVAWSATGPTPRRGRLECGVERSDDSPGYAHADAGAAARLEEIRARFTDAEWEAIRNPASAMVRLLARARLEQHLRGRGEAGPVEILTPTDSGFRRPPRVWAAGSEVSDVGVSLSHHGRFLAWAILLGPDV